MAKVFPAQAIDRLEVTIGSKKLGELFVELGYIDRSKLERALETQRKKGGQLGWILASSGFITRLQLYEGLAAHLGLPFETDMSKVLLKVDRKLAASMPHDEMVEQQAVPLFSDGNYLTLITARPNSPSLREYIKRKFRTTKIELIVATDTDIMKLAGGVYRDNLRQLSEKGLFNRSREESARTVFTKEQIAFAAGFVVMLGVLLFLETSAAVYAVLVLAQALFVLPLLFKLVPAVWGKLNGPPLTMKEAPKPYNEQDLPVYSILIPAYREKAVIGELIRSIRKFDYPEDKLDIILLFEYDDVETLEAAKAERPPANWRFMVCPDGTPRTKSRALSYGLMYARGEFVAVYDAGDLPRPDQLRKAVEAFRTHADDYFSFQASAACFNRSENFLTRMAALEQSAWHGSLLPGLLRMKIPAPSGKAGSHFDVKKLKATGAWDPFNVSEDADLGIKAASRGYKSGLIDSLTYKEAPPRFKDWLGQRSRQIKGYLQTSLVHSRHPLALIKTMGLFKWLSYTMLTGGYAAALLVNPLLWLLLSLSVLSDVTGFFYVPSALIYTAALSIIVGNVVFTLITLCGADGRKGRRNLWYALLRPVYGMLESLAAYKALFQLFFKPFYWEKTEHGLTGNIPVSRTMEIPSNVPEMVVIRDKQ